MLALPVAARQGEKFTIFIDRLHKQLYVLDSGAHVIFQDAIGIGAGGAIEKHSMSDQVTPTGKFIVDIILCKDKSFDAIGLKNVRRYAKSVKFASYVTGQKGLSDLFKNMCLLDFDKDGKADRAYGEGYIGLSGQPGEKTITGPKMSTFQGTPYWYSIALHGTDEPRKTFEHPSGGCIHLRSAALKKLIVEHLVSPGTSVLVTDHAPSVFSGESLQLFNFTNRTNH